MAGDHLPAPAMIRVVRRYMAETDQGLKQVAQRMAERFPDRSLATFDRRLRHLMCGRQERISLRCADEICVALDMTLPDERCARR